MHKSAIQKMLIFLFVCFVIVALLVVKFFSAPAVKAKDSQSLKVVNTSTLEQKAVNLDIPNPQKGVDSKSAPQIPATKSLIQNPQGTKTVKDVVSPEVVSVPKNDQANTEQSKLTQQQVINNLPAITNESEKICVSYGPLDVEKKATMDFILNKYKQQNNVKVDKKTAYLIFWNLGPDKKEAEKLFSKQKDNGGPLSDSKFVLTKNENNDYVVNIIRVNSGKAVAETLTNELIKKANKVKTGGQWLYKGLPEGYFYTFPEFNKLNPKAIESINVMIDAPKDPC